MVRYRRRLTSGSVFITMVTGQRRPWLVSSHGLDAFRRHFPTTLHKKGWRAIAWVLMPDHLHWLVEPTGATSLPLDEGADYSALVTAFKKSMIHELGSKFEGAPRWQARFWEHCIRDDADRQRHFDYIHWNPVKHGYANHPGEWLHSSFRSYVDAGWYPPDWIVDPAHERLAEGTWDV